MKTIERRIVHIGSKIKYYRLLNKISLSKLANDANISKSTLFGLEEGRSNPTISTLVNIASTLGISLNELIGNNTENSNNSNLTLISSADSKTHKLYKLTLMPNEYFVLKDIEASSIKIEVIDGEVSLIDNAITLYSGDNTIVNYNKKFKAYSSGATVILKVYNAEPIDYINEDIFYNFASKEILEESILNSRDKLISRVIFTSITPTANLNKIKYINYLEILFNKESHYYIYKRYQGLLGGINSYLKHLNFTSSSKYNKIEKFINLSISENSIKKETFNLLENHIISDVKNLLIDATTVDKKSISTVESIFNIDKQLIKNSNYILLLEELSTKTDNTKSVSLTLWLYRALESLYIADESSLDNSELKIFNTLIQNLLKALYFSYNNHINKSMHIIETLISELNKIKTIHLESKFIKNYLHVLDELENIVKRYNKNININSISLIESIAKDFNLNIEIKELVAPVCSKSGLYAYLFRVK